MHGNALLDAGRDDAEVFEESFAATDVRAGAKDRYQLDIDSLNAKASTLVLGDVRRHVGGHFLDVHSRAAEAEGQARRQAIADGRAKHIRGIRGAILSKRRGLIEDDPCAGHVVELRDELELIFKADGDVVRAFF